MASQTVGPFGASLEDSTLEQLKELMQKREVRVQEIAMDAQNRIKMATETHRKATENVAMSMSLELENLSRSSGR